MSAPQLPPAREQHPYYRPTKLSLSPPGTLPQHDEVADPNPNALYTPSTSDDPTITPDPQDPSPNTVLSAQTTNDPPASQQSGPTPPERVTRTRAARASRAAATTANTRTTRQLLGRRQRATSDDELERTAGEASSSSTAISTPDRRPQTKRRRAGSMLADGDGQASSNGTSRGLSNGSRALPRTPLGTSTNGTHKAASAGSLNGSSQNGKEVAKEAPPTFFGHDREEVTRILIQALSDMGYHDAARNVSRDSGYELESPTVASFRAAVLEGEWTEAEQLLFGAASAADGSQAGNGLVLAQGADRNVMRFWLRQQKFLELLEKQDTGRALIVLRTELTPLYQDTQQLHFLSSLLMCQSPEDLKAKAHWDGAFGESRHILLSELSSTSIFFNLSLPNLGTNTSFRMHITFSHAPGAPLSSAAPTGQRMADRSLSLSHYSHIPIIIFGSRV